MSSELDQYVMTESEAHRVTEDIRHNAKSFTEYRARLMDAVDKAKAGNAHLTLGYKSWTAYLSEVLGEEPMRLARAERQDMVRMLSDEGMSTRAIAPIVGADQKTIVNDRQATREENSSRQPALTNVNTETGEIRDEPTKVTGMDGKQYSRPELQKPKRRPITDAFFEATYDLGKLVERIERLTEDDRFSRNKNEIAQSRKSDLVRAADTLDSILRQLD